jgi:DNA-binding transcriptional regulator LsrR (DeoR family)
MDSQDRLQLLATIADLYYVEKQSQAAIAEMYGYSRPTISRLIGEAQEKGLVEIRINYPLQRMVEMEVALRERFNLSFVNVADRGSLDYGRMLRLIGRLAAAYFDRVENLEVIGVSWGTAVYEVVTSLQRRRLPHVRIVQMIGGIGGGASNTDGPEVARLFAHALGGQHTLLNAPLVVPDEQTRSVLMADRQMRDVLSLIGEADYALVGVGSLDVERSSLLRAGYLNRGEVDALLAQDIVGDICGVHFDSQGRIPDIDINRRRIGVDLRALADSPCTIVAVAGGRVKAPAILGALRGGLIDVLITDSNAAEVILAG